MNKKFTFPLFLGVLGLVVAIGFAAYYFILAPIYNQNQDHKASISFTGIDKTVSFHKHSNQEEVFSLELEISGRTDKNFEVLLSDGIQALHFARVKGGNVDFAHVGDWYSDELVVILKPSSDERGKLDITCRFISF